MQNHRAHGQFLDYCSDADAVLQYVGLQGEGFEYLRLWAERTYHLCLDQGTFIKACRLFARPCVLLEEDHHPAIGRDHVGGMAQAYAPSPKKITRFLANLYNE